MVSARSRWYLRRERCSWAAEHGRSQGAGPATGQSYLRTSPGQGLAAQRATRRSFPRHGCLIPARRPLLAPRAGRSAARGHLERGALIRTLLPAHGQSRAAIGDSAKRDPCLGAGSMGCPGLAANGAFEASKCLSVAATSSSVKSIYSCNTRVAAGGTRGFGARGSL